MRNRLALFLAFSLAAPAALADLPAFTELDRNADGSLSEREAAVLEAFQGDDSEFVDADLNSDRGLDPAEYQRWLEQVQADTALSGR